MPFKGITFAGQNVTPKNDGGLYQSHFSDGILWGCGMGISDDDLVIQSGEFIMGGRVVQVDGATSVPLGAHGLTTGYVRVIMNADMSQPEGSQWYANFDTDNDTDFPALTMEDINNTGNLYQLEVAIIQVSGGNLTSLYRTMKHTGTLMPGENFVLDSNGDRKAKIDGINWTGTGFVSCLSGGQSVAGMIVDNECALGCPAGESIIFRPNGFTSNIHSWSIDETGMHCYDDSGDVPSTGSYSSKINQSFTFGGRSSVYHVYKWGRFCTLTLDMGNGTAFTTGNATAFTLDAEYRPVGQVFGNGLARTSGAWASATYYPFNISINTSGAVGIASNENNFKSCTYAVGGITFLCAK